MRTIAMNKFVGTQYKCEVLAEFDLPEVIDQYGDTYRVLSSSISTTPDGDPLLHVERNGEVGHIFVETIMTIQGEEA